MVIDKNHKKKKVCLIKPGTGGRKPMKTFPRKYAGIPAMTILIIRINFLSSIQNTCSRLRL
jgi:hypothetical protein